MPCLPSSSKSSPGRQAPGVPPPPPPVCLSLLPCPPQNTSICSHIHRHTHGPLPVWPAHT
eukprot:356910-Chlamydomonas_euryale.AAC.5